MTDEEAALARTPAETESEPTSSGTNQAPAPEPVCSVKMTGHERPRCGRPIHPAPPGADERPVCLMHSNDPAKQSEGLFEEFWAEFERILETAGEEPAHFEHFIFPQTRLATKEFQASCSFREAEFARGADFRGATFARTVSFSGARFKRDAIFAQVTFAQNADFGGATFELGASFSNAIIIMNAKFNNAQFNQHASFRAASFERNARFNHVQFMKRANFAAASFTGNARFLETKFFGDAVFNRATFLGHASYRRASFLLGAAFKSAKFIQAAHFDKATVRGTANYTDTSFESDTSFRSTSFGDNVTFSGSEFFRKAVFDRATFAQIADLHGAKFFEGATFSGNIFGGHADFARCDFVSDVRFDTATFLGPASFGLASFGGTVDWQSSSFMDRVEFRRTKFEKQAEKPSSIFSLAKFARPDQVVFDEVDLSRALFHNCDINEIWFTSSVLWAKRKGNRGLAVFDEIALLGSKTATKAQKNAPRNPAAVAQIYQQLKKNYDSRLDYLTANEFHYGEMEMKRLDVPWTGRLLGTRQWFHRNLRLVSLYRLASDYGNNFRKPAAWMILVLLLFATLLPVPGIALKHQAPDFTQTYATVWSKTDQWKPNLLRASRVWAKALITAIDTEAFQRNPEYLPGYPWGRVLAIIATLMNSILFALFLLALRRQFRR